MVSKFTTIWFYKGPRRFTYHKLCCGPFSFQDAALVSDDGQSPTGSRRGMITWLQGTSDTLI